MPWTANDGPARHTKKAKSGAAKKQWAAVANKILSEGGPDAEGKAVRIANSAVAKRKGKSNPFSKVTHAK